jgi:tryptophan-rich sensory protein
MHRFDRWTLSWLLGCVAFAVHIAEEIAFGSFGVYADFNVFVNTIFPQLRLPSYKYEVWLTNLIGACVLLFILTWLVYAKRGPMRLASYLFATFLTLNGIGHLYAALTMETYFPGAATAIALVFAGLLLFVATPSRDNPNRAT